MGVAVVQSFFARRVFWCSKKIKLGLPLHSLLLLEMGHAKAKLTTEGRKAQQINI